jgi:hypothetical protein
MARKDFIDQAVALGYKIQEPDGSKVIFEYVVPVGKNIGKRIVLGFEVSNDYPMNCPPGPHIKAIDSGWREHPQNVSDSPFNNLRDLGSGWRYWSRPFKEWNRSDRNFKAYMAHIKNLMMSL